MQEVQIQAQLETLKLPLHDPLLQRIKHICLEENIDTTQWKISRSQDEMQMWLVFRYSSVELPEQGWKLHISADTSSAETVLQRVLPLLLQKMVAFKCTSSLENLRLLNNGQGGQSQIGKFFTIYPRNNEEVVALASQLDEATRGLCGPQVPSDRMLHPGSLVFYRYGGYAAKHIQDKIGRILPAIRTQDDQLIPDIRSRRYQPPEDVTDPFLRAAIAADLPKIERILTQRYLIISVISASVNHIISMAVDLKIPRTCIIKRPGRIWQNALPSSERQYVLQEAAVLRELAGHTRVPVLFDLIEQDSDIALVMSDIPGQTLMERLSRKGLSGPISFTQIISWSRDLAEILADTHQRGFVYADLKPTNVIIGPDEKLYLIDFELAGRQGISGQAGRGTTGYMSPQQFAGEPRSIADDIYSFGALLYLLVTGAEPSHAPDPFALLKRPIESLRAHVPSMLKTIIGRCLQAQSAARYASMNDIITALDAVDEDNPHSVSQDAETSLIDEAQARTIAQKLLHTLCAIAHKPENGEGLTWKTTHPIAENHALRDLNAGLAGTVFALAGLAGELEEPEAYNILAQGANWLRATQPHSDPPLPGLYVGEAGVGAALLLAGTVLADHTLIDVALERGRQIATLPHTSPDLMHGTAGRLLFHLLLWEETGADEQLTAALVCGEHLLEVAQIHEQGEISWSIPAEFKGFNRDGYLGYAHGIAGIADVLLDLFDVTGDERFVPVIQHTAKWLQQLAMPVLTDQSGLSWPETKEQNTPFHPFWCHGSAGIGRFFLHASRHSWLPGAIEMVRGAAQSVIHLSRATGPVLCHGLAGSIEFLLDMYQESRNPLYLKEAQVFGKLLEAFATESNGLLVFHSDHGNVFSPDYQVGYAGIAISFLRLSAPEHIPYQLSLAGFRAYKQRAETGKALLKR